MVTPQPECVLDAGARLGECPVWHPDERALYWIDCAAPALHRFDPADRTATSHPLAGHIGSFALRRGAGAVAALSDGFANMDLASGEWAPICEPEAGAPEIRFNDGKCDPQGRFWAGSMHKAYSAPIGTLYRLDPDGRCHAMMGGFRVPNGLAWSPDGATFYIANSPDETIYAFDFEGRDGTIANRRTFVGPAAAPGWPDGSAMDSEGYLWNARWDGGCVVRFAPDGRIDRTVELPVTRPTSCAFGGAALDTLFITSANIGLDASSRASQPLAGGVFALEAGVTGLPEPRFVG